MARPLFLITASKWFLYLLTRILHVSTGILAHSPLAKASRFLMLDGFRAITPFFNSLHRFSNGFKSGLWLGHSKTLTSLFRSHALTNLAVCFWIIVVLRPPRLSESMFICVLLIFCSKIFMCCSLFIMQSTFTRFPGPLAEKHPQIIILAPPCLTVGTACLGLNATLRFLVNGRS